MEFSRTTWSNCSGAQNYCTIQIIKYQTHIWTLLFNPSLRENYFRNTIAASLCVKCTCLLLPENIYPRLLATGYSWTGIWREARVYVRVCVCAGGNTNQTDELSLAEVHFKTDILQNIFNSSAKHIMELVISFIEKKKQLSPSWSRQPPSRSNLQQNEVTPANTAHSTSWMNYVFC